MNRIVAASVLVLVFGAAANARVMRVVIDHRESPAYQGQSFGEAGKYERLSGHAYGELDPKDPLNAIITDLQFAPRNSRGMVEYSATFLLVRPVDLSKASGVLLYEVPNRGNSTLARPAGMPEYFKRGHVVLTSGWQGDLTPREGIETVAVPIAKNPDGSSITGRVLADFVDMPSQSTTLPILRGRFPASPPATLDTSKATLTRGASEDGVLTPLRSTDWAFADCTKTPFPGTPDPGRVCVKDGFDPAFRYELVYTTKDPLVFGIGYAATRDINAYFKSGESQELPKKMPFAVALVKFAIRQFSALDGAPRIQPG